MRERIEIEAAEAHPEEVPLFRHKKRPRWGVALRAWKAGHKVGYLFEDGAFRRFRAEYEHLFEPVDLSESERVVAVEMLLDELSERADGADTSSFSAAAVVSRTEYVPAQVGLLKDEYPEGFRGESWREMFRGEEADRRVKRHISPALDDAAETLARDQLEPLLESDPAAIWKRATDLLTATDLVTPSQLDAYKSLDDDGAAEMGRALFDRLYGDKSERSRFRRFVRTGKSVTGRKMGWSIATALPALVRPGKDLVVRSSVARAFIRLFGLDMALSKHASYPGYQRYRRLVLALKEELESDGLAPADLFDVHRFLRLTLSTTARARLQALVEARRAAPAMAGA